MMPPTSAEIFFYDFFFKLASFPPTAASEMQKWGCASLLSNFFHFFFAMDKCGCALLPLNAHVFHVALNAHWCASITLALSAHVLHMALNMH